MRILIADDHGIVRGGLKLLIERQPDMEVVAEAEDGTTALARARETHPELALVDVYLPDIDGFEVATRLKELDGAPAVVLISSRTRAEVDPLVPQSGARGFLPKDELSREAIEELL